jgi:hypothetical protein
MKRNTVNRELIRERLTLFLVILFCILISSSEYVSLADTGDPAQTEAQNCDTQDSSEGHKTFLNTAVDAVVPFVIVAVDHAFHLIYEIIDGDNTVFAFDFNIAVQNNHFFEVLFEQIISVNAP